MRSALLFALGGVVAAGIAVVVAAAEQAPDSASSPLEPQGAWRSALIVGGIASCAAYALAAIVLRRQSRLLPWVLAVAVVVQLIPLAGPVLLSRDVYAYWAYGRIGAVHEGNPYSNVPADYRGDPAVARMGTSWLETSTFYGPGWTLVAEGVSATVSSARAAAYAFRALAAASILAVVGFAVLLARNRPFAAVLVGWNPLLALHVAGGGHNDALMMALALGALVLAARGRPGAAGFAWAAAIAVKWVAAAFAGLVLVARRFRSKGLAVGLAAGGAVVALTSTFVYGAAWLESASGLSSQARRTGSIGLAGWLDDLGLSHRPTVAVIGVLTIAVVAWLVWQAWNGRARLGLAGVLLAAVQGWLNPWYAIWGASLAAAEDDAAAHVGVVLLTALLLRDALPI